MDKHDKSRSEPSSFSMLVCNSGICTATFLEREFLLVSLGIHWYPFFLRGWERFCDITVSCLRTQHNDHPRPPPCPNLMRLPQEDCVSRFREKNIQTSVSTFFNPTIHVLVFLLLLSIYLSISAYFSPKIAFKAVFDFNIFQEVTGSHAQSPVFCSSMIDISSIWWLQEN